MRSIDSVACLILLATLVLFGPAGPYGMASALSSSQNSAENQYASLPNVLTTYSRNALKCENKNITFNVNEPGCHVKANPVSHFPSSIPLSINKVCALQFNNTTDSETGASALLNDLNKIFSEGSTPTIFNETNSGDLYFTVVEENTYFKITYLKASCSNKNSLGYFKYDVDNKAIIFPKGVVDRQYPGPFIFYSLSTETHDCYPEGYSIEYGPFKTGEAIGFYLVDKGFDCISNTTGAHMFNFTSLSRYSVKSLNDRDYQPIYVWVHLPDIDAYMIGFDDNGWTSDGEYRDLDYNDIIVLLEVNKSNVTIQHPPPDYGDGKLHVCSLVEVVPESTWFQREEYTYALLEASLQSDCVNYLKFSAPWEWANYDEDAKQAYSRGILTTWRNYRHKTFVFNSTSEASKQIEVFMDISNSDVNEIETSIDYFKKEVKSDESGSDSGDKKDESASEEGEKSAAVANGGKKSTAASRCVWVGCRAVRVIRRPTTIFTSNSAPSLCMSGKANLYSGTRSSVSSVPNPDLSILEISGLEDKDVEVSNLRLLRPSFTMRVLSLYLYYDFSGISSQKTKNLFTDSAANFLESNLGRDLGGFSSVRVSLYFYRPGLTPTYKYVGRADELSDLSSLFNLAGNQATSSTSSVGEEAGSNMLTPLSKVVSERDTIASYKAVVVFAGKAWNESTEDKFAQAARESGRSIGFVCPSSLSSALNRLKDKIPYMWSDTVVWSGSNWYTAIAGSAAAQSQNYVIRGYQMTPRMYSVYPEHESLFKFDSNAKINRDNSEVDLSPKYTVTWRVGSQTVKDLVKQGDGVVRTQIGLSGWGVVSLNIMYNRPPMGRDVSMTSVDTKNIVELPVSDPDSGNLLNIQIVSLPGGNATLSYLRDGVEEMVEQPGTFINEFSEDGTPKYDTTNKLIYALPHSGSYSFKYSVYDGCVASQEYTVTITGELPNIQPRANHSTIVVDVSNGVLKPLMFNITNSLIDPDIHDPVYVWFDQLDFSKGNFLDSEGRKLKLASEYVDGDPYVHYKDILSFIPSRTFQPYPGQTYQIALYRYQETSNVRNMSNTAYLYAQYSWSGEANPILRFQNNRIKIDPTTSKASFVMVIEDIPGSKVHVYVDNMTAGNAIVDGTTTLINYTSSSLSNVFDEPIMQFVKVGENAFTAVSGLVWATTLQADTSEDVAITGTFHAERVEDGGQLTGQNPKSDTAILTLTLSSAGSVDSKNKTPTAYNVNVPAFGKAQRSPNFDLAGTDLITPAPGNKGFVFFVSSPPIGRDESGRAVPWGALYRVDTNEPLAVSRGESADGPYASGAVSYTGNTDGRSNFQSSEVYYGSKLSVYFQPTRVSSAYPKGALNFTYTVFNNYTQSEPAMVMLNITDSAIPPTSADRQVYLKQELDLTDVFPLQLSNGMGGVYLEIFLPADEKNIYIGAVPTGSGTAGNSSRGSSVIIKPSETDRDAVSVYFKMLSDIYTYLPNNEPLKYDKTFEFRACDKYSVDGRLLQLACSSNYTIEIYVLHVPHPPKSEDQTYTVQRSATLKIRFPMQDRDDYDRGKLQSTIYVYNFPLNGTLYSDEQLTQPLGPLGAGSSITIKSTVVYYVSDTLREEALRPRDVFSYVLTDTTKLQSDEASVAIYVNPRGDPPSTKLSEINALQYQNLTFSLTDTKQYVSVEVSSSSATATITSLPRGTLYECTDSMCSSSETVAITSVPHALVVSGLDSNLIYLSPPYEWGTAFTTIRYTLADTTSNKSSSEFTLTVNVDHVNNVPIMETLGSSFGDGKAITLKQTDVHDFEWKLTDVDTLPSELYTVLVTSVNQYQRWSLHRCVDRECGSLGSLISNGSKVNVNDRFSMAPTEVANDDCKSTDALYKLNGTLTENTKCYAYFKCRLYADADVSYTTAIGLTFIGSDNQISTDERGVVIRHSFVNRPPFIWAPVEIISEAGTTNPFIRDNDPNSETYNKSVSITDIGALSRCEEKLTMTSDTPGEFVLSTSARRMCTLTNISADDSPNSPQLPLVTCIGSVDGLNSWLPELRFSTSQTTATLTFVVDDQGCSSDVDNDESYTSTVTTRLNLTATSSSSGKVVGIVAGSAAAAGVVVLSTLAYFLRHGMSSPPDVYFDIGSESVSTAPQNPLFQPSTQEYSSSIYRNA